MTEHRAELSSVRNSLEDLRTRLTDAAEAYDGAERGDIAHELGEIERLVHTAARRLQRLDDQL